MARHPEGPKLSKIQGSPYWYIVGLPRKLGRRKSTGQTTWEAANAVLEGLRHQLSLKQRPADSFTIKEIIDMYLEEHAIHKPSYDTSKFYARQLVAFFGDDTPDDLTPLRIGAYTQQQLKTRKPGTVKRELTILSAALNHARKNRMLTAVPFIPMPSTAGAKERWLRPQEAVRLLNACTGHLKLFVAIALFTGARKGAILQLEWDRVDLKAGTINFAPAGHIQTKKRRAVVPVNSQLMRMLKAIKARKGHVIQFNGKAIKDIKKGFREACKRARLSKDVTPHTLRHTAGTWMAQAGVDMWRIGGVLGHTSQRTTELYAKHHPEYMKEATESLALNLRSNKTISRKKPQKTVRGR